MENNYEHQFLEEVANDATGLIDCVTGLASPSEDDWIGDMLTNANADDNTMEYWYSHLLNGDDDNTEPGGKILIGSGPDDKVCVTFSILS